MTTTASTLPHDDPAGYDHLLSAVQAHFDQTAAGQALFATDAEGLYAAYLDHLPEARQLHTCAACRRFIERFGGLVTINTDGTTTPVMWNPATAPALYAEAIAAMAKRVARARVVGVFLSDLPQWGTPQTGDWTHFAVTPAPQHIHHSPIQTPFQAMAAKVEDYRTIQAALEQFSAATVTQAVTLLSSEQMPGFEKALGPAKWLQQLQTMRAATKQTRQREHKIWLAVATAPAGFCHIRATILGTLLDDIAAGLDFAEIKRRFGAMTRPDRYQRPQAAPTEGNIARAEQIVAQLGIAAALRRRYARLDEIETIWRPQPPVEMPTSGVFGHLRAQAQQPGAVQIPAITITWEKFARTVLPGAMRMELKAPSGMAAWGCLVTAVDPEAEPILQWDSPQRRNPFSWYVYVNGSPAAQWGLRSDRYYPVTAITLQPSMWYGGNFTHQGESVLLLVEGAKDSRNTSLVLFPSCLKSTLHEVRATIEAYSNSRKLEGAEEASAAGLRLQKGQPLNTLVRVTTQSGTQEYVIDRWD